MSKISVSFTDLMHSGHNCNYIPYGTTVVASYLLKYFDNKVNVNVFKHTVDFIKYLEGKIPEVCCFSNYLWNFNLSYEIARRVKEVSPKTVIIFGGPNYPINITEQKTFLLTYPDIDFYVFREGELAIVELFNRLFEYDFDISKIKEEKINIPSCHYMANDVVCGALLPRLKTLDDIPSPYLTGLCDNFLNNGLVPLVQTTRGCPFSCSFCQAGNTYFNQINRFSFKRINGEIEYIAQRTSSPNLMLADSNFGMYKKDIEICKMIATIQEKYSYPKNFRGIEGKNHKDRIIEAASIVTGAYLSTAVQSTDESVLTKIKRQNVSLEQLINTSKYSEVLGSTSFSELILCLPGDTKEAHFKSASTLIDAGIGVVRSHQLIMFPGAEVNDSKSRQQYGIQTRFRVSPSTADRYLLFGREFEAPEIDEICVANNTMTFDDYIECRLFNLTLEIFYNDGVIIELIKFLKLYKISASLFIIKLHNYLTSTTNKLSSVYDGFLRKTKELWEDKKELEAYLKQPEIIEKYILGELGYNEQLVYRSKVILNNMEDLQKIAFDVAKGLLVSSGSFDNNVEHYLGELYKFNICRKKDILSVDAVIKKQFHYDFVELDKDGFNGYPIDYNKNVIIEFFHTEEQKKLFSQYIKLFGMTDYGLGNIISNAANVKSLYRVILRVE